MFRFLVRHGMVRMVGGRAVPVLLAWDLLVLANRTRRIPIVDRSLRRGASAAGRRAAAFADRRRWPIRAGAAGRGRRHRDDGEG